jgi:hypothetical protein
MISVGRSTNLDFCEVRKGLPNFTWALKNLAPAACNGWEIPINFAGGEEIETR